MHRKTPHIPRGRRYAQFDPRWRYNKHSITLHYICSLTLTMIKLPTTQHFLNNRFTATHEHDQHTQLHAPWIKTRTNDSRRSPLQRRIHTAAVCTRLHELHLQIPSQLSTIADLAGSYNCFKLCLFLRLSNSNFNLRPFEKSAPSDRGQRVNHNDGSMESQRRHKSSQNECEQ